MRNEKYQKAADFLGSLVNIPDPVKYSVGGRPAGKKEDKRKFFIKRLRYLLKLLGNPDERLKFIHITGTSGKTSTTFFTSAILSAAGFKVGVFISPHITSITERIHFGEKLISAKDLAEIIEYLKPFLSRCAAESPFGCPSFFEIMLAAAIIYFKNKHCDYAILEAGIGGMFDATNVIKKSEVEIITNVGLDHTDVLGKTKKAIAKDKAGIIKRGGRFFTTEREKNIYKIFEEICRAKKVPYRRVNGDCQILKSDLSGVEFFYEGKKLKIMMPGEHQALNAVLAFEAVRKIIKDDWRAMRNGLAKVFVPCRLEKVSAAPTVILDGAHNADKMRTTADFIRKHKHRSLSLVIGLAKNKDAAGILKEIVPLADKIYLTRFLQERRKSQTLGNIGTIAKRLTKKKIFFHIDPHEALAAARKSAGRDDLILVTGSFFLAGELREDWFSEEYILEKRKMR